MSVWSYISFEKLHLKILGYIDLLLNIRIYWFVTCSYLTHMCAVCPYDHTFQIYIRKYKFVVGYIDWLLTLTSHVCAQCVRMIGACDLVKDGWKGALSAARAVIQVIVCVCVCIMYVYMCIYTSSRMDGRAH